MDRTLVLVKPDGVARGLIGEIVSRLERKGLRVVAGRLVVIERALAEEHYAEHRERPFFSDIVAFLSGGPSFALVVEGPKETFRVVRALMGATDPAEAAPGTIRGDLAAAMPENLIHGSDSPEAAAREIALFFPDLD